MTSLALRALAATFLVGAAPAIAAPQLLSAVPAGSAANVTRASLAFSEAIVPQASGIALVMTGMPGMAHHDPMKIAGFETSVGDDGKTLIAAFPRALPAGSYKLDWHAAGADTQQVTGTLTFTVR